MPFGLEKSREKKKSRCLQHSRQLRQYHSNVGGAITWTDRQAESSLFSRDGARRNPASGVLVREFSSKYISGSIGALHAFGIVMCGLQQASCVALQETKIDTKQ